MTSTAERASGTLAAATGQAALINRPSNDLPLAFSTLGSAVLAVVGLVPLALTIAFIPLMVVWVGAPMMLAAIVLLRAYANLHRKLAGLVHGVQIPSPYRRRPPAKMFARAVTTLRDPATWRDLAWVCLNATAGLVLKAVAAALFFATIFYTLWPFLNAITSDGMFDTILGFIPVPSISRSALYAWPLALLCAVGWRWLGNRLIRWDAGLTRWLLAPTQNAALAARVTELTASRADTVDTSAAELRRIERDLHDGAQARLAALTMNLGMAENLIRSDPDEAQRLLTEARSSAGVALSELRDLVRGIHPPVLADRGLTGALQALGMAAPIPVQVTVELPRRPGAPVESAGYFACAEAIANITKHASARGAWIDVSHDAGRLRLLVGDDGHGGAQVVPGGGLAGVQRRLAAFDGTLTVSSPPGGPTTVGMELPCEL